MSAAERPKVLIVEDDADARTNLQDILELEGYEPLAASGVEEAIGKCDWSSLLAVILDRRLPNGLIDEYLPRLKQLAPQAAFIIVTGHADLSGAIAALRFGAADFLLKPVDAGILCSRLSLIAENRRMRDALARSEEKLLQSERLAAIGQMMTGLSHESRNALQRSQACLEMLALEVQDRPAALDLVGRIQKAQDHLHQLYEEVRDYAAPIRLNRDVYDLRRIMRETWEHLEVQRRDRRTQLEAVKADCDTRARVDRLAVEQVFRNILENSLAAVGDPVEIKVDWRDTLLEGYPALQISISDNGPGLNGEVRRRIFEPFFTTKTKGTGLGMAIVRRIVEAHGGWIRVGDDGPGAKILISLPRDLNGALTP